MLKHASIVLTAMLCAQVCAQDDEPAPYHAADGKWGFCVRIVRHKNDLFDLDWSLRDGDKIAIPAQYDRVGFFHEGIARVARAGAGKSYHWGYIDSQGKQITAMLFNCCRDFFQGRAAVYETGAWGLIDRKGIFILPAEYKHIGATHCGRLRIQTEKGWGFADLDGNEVVAPRYEQADDYIEGFARIVRAGKRGWLDLAGREIALGEFEGIGYFSEGLAGAKKTGKWGFADTSGKLAIMPAWESAESFHLGLANVKSGEKSGCIDRDGKLVVPAEFFWIGRFGKEGLAPATTKKSGGLRDEFAYIRRNGEIAFPYRFVIAHDFNNGFASVLDEKTWQRLYPDGRLEPELYSGQIMASIENEPDWGFDAVSFQDTFFEW